MKTTTQAPEDFFKQSVIHLAAETPRDNTPLLKAIAALSSSITELTKDDPQLANLVFNDVLNQVDPAWRVKVGN